MTVPFVCACFYINYNVDTIWSTCKCDTDSVDQIIAVSQSPSRTIEHTRFCIHWTLSAWHQELFINLFFARLHYHSFHPSRVDRSFQRELCIILSVLYCSTNSRKNTHYTGQCKLLQKPLPSIAYLKVPIVTATKYCTYYVTAGLALWI